MLQRKFTDIIEKSEGDTQLQLAIAFLITFGFASCILFLSLTNKSGIQKQSL